MTEFSNLDAHNFAEYSWYFLTTTFELLWLYSGILYNLECKTDLKLT